MSDPIRHGPSLFSDQDIYLFKEGTHHRLYDKMGAHPMVVDGIKGVLFSVWAPNAQEVYVIGDFNQWNEQSHPLANRWDSSGIFEGFIPNVPNGASYKYLIHSPYSSEKIYKSDPFAFFHEQHPSHASKVCDLEYAWKDQEWMQTRQKHTSLQAPLSIYEVHLGSWCHDNKKVSYKELATQLVPYVKDLGFTFVEFLPLIEHPFYGSWGYQSTGFFAPTSRYGSPQDLMFLIDSFHQNGIGVILDWVPSHFPSDSHGLARFDGTCLFEHEDPKKGFHPDWNTLVFNYGRGEVKEFLMSSALFWLDHYHVDGIRVDAVASMLYLDYSRKPGEWIPNKYGGNANLEAVDFLKTFNQVVYKEFPTVQTIAEESTAWPLVTRPIDIGGLGFGIKWNMGWMHDTLEYFSKDPVHRKFHQHQITFSLLYSFKENFLLPFSHDEVVYGKGSIFQKMPGDVWQKYANMRLVLGYLYSHPGKKLLFMGTEFAKHEEWNHDKALSCAPWNVDQKNMYQWVKDLNFQYRELLALHENDFDWQGFEWLDCGDCANSVLCFIRKTKESKEIVAVFCNFTPVPHNHYRIGLPNDGHWEMVLNSDDKKYSGSSYPVCKEIITEDILSHGRPFSATVTLPPLGILMYKYRG